MNTNPVWDQIVRVKDVQNSGVCWDEKRIKHFANASDTTTLKEVFFNTELSKRQNCWICSKYGSEKACFVWSADCLGRALDVLKLKHKDESLTFLNTLAKKAKDPSLSICHELGQNRGIDELVSRNREIPPLNLLHALRLFRAFSDKGRITKASWSVVFSVFCELPSNLSDYHWSWAWRNLGLNLTGEREEIEDGASFGLYPL